MDKGVQGQEHTITPGIETELKDRSLITGAVRSSGCDEPDLCTSVLLNARLAVLHTTQKCYSSLLLTYKHGLYCYERERKPSFIKNRQCQC